MCNYLEIIDLFYSKSDPAREILLFHSRQVTEKALAIAKNFSGIADLELISCGAMLHDIGIRFCNAPDIGCFGEDNYLLHGILGAENLRCLRIPGIEKVARICERHTGSGITADEIISGSLPLPQKDFLPESLEEKIICLADKFFSKSGDMQEKSLEDIRRGMKKFGDDSLARFDAMYNDLLLSCCSQKI